MNIRLQRFNCHAESSRATRHACMQPGTRFHIRDSIRSAAPQRAALINAKIRLRQRCVWATYRKGKRRLDVVIGALRAFPVPVWVLRRVHFSEIQMNSIYGLNSRKNYICFNHIFLIIARTLNYSNVNFRERKLLFHQILLQTWDTKSHGKLYL